MGIPWLPYNIYVIGKYQSEGQEVDICRGKAQPLSVLKKNLDKRCETKLIEIWGWHAKKQ
jgi:hypothetical protein